MFNPEIRIKAGVLEIASLRVDDLCSAEYVQSFDGQEKQIAAVQNCIQLGARALSFAADQSSTTMLSDSLKQATEGHKALLETLVKQTNENVIRTAEELPKKLNSILKLVEKDLAKTLDPASASSIVGKLQTELVSGISKETAKLALALDLRNPASAFA